MVRGRCRLGADHKGGVFRLESSKHRRQGTVGFEPPVGQHPLGGAQFDKLLPPPAVGSQ